MAVHSVNRSNALAVTVLLLLLLRPNAHYCTAEKKPRADTPHLAMDFASQTHTRIGHDFKQNPLFLKIPSMTRPRFRHITLYQLAPAVEQDRLDVLFEWHGSNEGKNWTTVLAPGGPTGLKCNFPKLSGGYYTADVIPRDLIRKIGGRAVYKAYCKLPATVKARFKHMECVNVTITGTGVETQQHAGKGPHTMLTCPPSFQGHVKMAMCMATPMYGFATIGSKIAQWLEYYAYVMSEDIHFYIYVHRFGTPAILQGWFMLKPYVEAGLATIVWECEWATSRFYSSSLVPHQMNANDCLSRAKGHATWIANIIDVDEYIAPMRNVGGGREKNGWSVPIEAGAKATGVMDYRAIFEKADNDLVLCPHLYATANCKVTSFGLAKWAAIPHERDGDLNVPAVVGDTHTHAIGKHICRVDMVALMGIHTEMAFEESFDWNKDRLVQTFTSNPGEWHPKDKRRGSTPSTNLVEYEMLHFNMAEWRRWVLGEKLRKGPPHNERQLMPVEYRVLDNVWTRIELNLAKRFNVPEGLFAERVVQNTETPWSDLDNPANG